jgi:hypothetical protein
MEMVDPPAPRGRNTGQILVGVIVLAAGAMLLAQRYFEPHVPLMRSWWPLLLVLMGAIRIVTADSNSHCRSGRVRSGVWLIMIGAWAFVSDSHLFGFSYATSWPLLVIGSGVMIVWRSVETGSRRPMRREQ